MGEMVVLVLLVMVVVLVVVLQTVLTVLVMVLVAMVLASEYRGVRGSTSSHSFPLQLLPGAPTLSPEGCDLLSPGHGSSLKAPSLPLGDQCHFTALRRPQCTQALGNGRPERPGDLLQIVTDPGLWAPSPKLCVTCLLPSSCSTSISWACALCRAPCWGLQHKSSTAYNDLLFGKADISTRVTHEGENRQRVP